jgi:hypothetical protein
MSHEITTPSGNKLFGLWLADADWHDDDFPDLEPLIVGIQKEAVDALVVRMKAWLAQDPDDWVYKTQVEEFLGAYRPVDNPK